MLTVKSSSGNCLTLLRAHDSTWPGNFPAFPSFPIWIPFVRISDACPLEILICKLSNKTAYGKWQTAADCRTRWQVNLIYNRARVIHLGQTPASCKWQPPTLYLYFLVFSSFFVPQCLRVWGVNASILKCIADRWQRGGVYDFWFMICHKNSCPRPTVWNI